MPGRNEPGPGVSASLECSGPVASDANGSVNGAAAGLVSVGDKIIIMAFGYVPDEGAATVQPKVVLVDHQNRLARQL